MKRAFLAGDAAHLLGALGTQGLDEGLRDAENLAWKLALAWHHGASDALLDSYQAERRAAVASRLRAADQSLPILRGGGGLRTLVPGSARGHDSLLMDGHLGCGPLGAPPSYALSPLAPPRAEAHTSVGTPPVRRWPMSGSRRPTAPRYGCASGWVWGSCWWCSSRREPESGTGATGCAPE